MTATIDPHGSFVPVNDLQIYVEQHGQGDPLLLIHGGIVSSSMWKSHLPDFAAHFRVIMPDSRGHGQTTHPGGPITYQMMADDMAMLIRTLDLEQLLICGYSDGGQIGLDLAIRYPQLARALVIGGATYRWPPAYYEIWNQLGMIAPGVVDYTPFLSMIDRLRSLPYLHLPNWDDVAWGVYQTSISTAWLTPLLYSDDSLRGVTMPMLILAGDRDDHSAPLDDVLTMYRLIPRAELAIVPGADHLFLLTRPAAFTSLVLDFLLRHREAPTS